jgi:dihydrofolate synthase/folylpolyglutamate synthase
VPAIRDFASAVRFLAAHTDYELMAARYSPRTYNLSRMRRLVAALGHPERAFRSLHVAGTKGKGSTAILAEAILREEGYRTGLYTSPHLVHLLERIQVGGRNVAERDFVRAMRRMEPHLRRLRPTFFEIMTAAAFVLFAEQGVDWAVVEVGLGGRLDATNVLLPAACAITPVDFDHMEKLGRTISAIAGEKAGIIKPGIPVVTGPQRPAALRVIRRRAEPFRPRLRRHAGRSGMVEFSMIEVRGRYSAALRALGRHHADNAATAVALVEAGGAAVSRGGVRRALASARLPARVEVVARRPWIVVDSCHNPVSARALAGALRGLRRRRTILVFGASADKDWSAMLRTLLPAADLTVFTRARSARAAEPETLARRARRAAVTVGEVGRALRLARRLAGPGDAIVVAGSFYVAGEALAELGRRDG